MSQSPKILSISEVLILSVYSTVTNPATSNGGRKALMTSSKC